MKLLFMSLMVAGTLLLAVAAAALVQKMYWLAFMHSLGALCCVTVTILAEGDR